MTSIKLNFDLKDFSEYLDLSRFQFLYVAVNCGVIAIASSKYLILANGTSGEINQYSDIRSVLEFREHSGTATCVVWMTDDVLCVGFDTGYILCFSTAGEELFEYRGSKSCVQSLKIFNNINGKAPGLWILYESGYLIYIPISQVLKGKSDSFFALRFPNHNGVNDFAFCPNFYVSSLFDLEEEKDASSHNIFVSGLGCAMSLYNVGNKLLNQDWDKSASSKSNSMFTRTVMSLFSMSSSSDVSKKNDKSEEHLRVAEKCIVVNSLLDFNDPKRRILRLSVEPYGSLIAAADTLGRVSLFETSTNTIVRVWKGLRDARLSWTHSFKELTSEISRENALLHLVIYAPQLGLVSIYRMTQGACVRIVPVGLNAHLLMTVDPIINNDFKIAKSYVLRSIVDTGVVEMTEINPVEYADTDIDLRSALLLQSMGDLSLNEDFEYTDAEESILSDKKMLETRTLQRIKSNLSRLAEMHGSLSKASIAARAQNIDLSTRFDENLTVGVETFILELLADCQCGYKSLMSVMQWVESMEVCGNLTYAQSGSNNSERTKEDAPCLCFSVGFHRKLLSLMSETLSFDEGNAGVDEAHRESVEFEVRIRNKLLTAYELLLEIRVQSNGGSLNITPKSPQQAPNKDPELNFTPQKSELTSGSRVATPQPSSSIGHSLAASLAQQSVVEEAAVICRTNSSRAEALCWALRAGKKQLNRNKAKAKSSASSHQSSILTPKSLRGALTPPPSGGAKRPTDPHSANHSPTPSIIVTPVHDGRNESTSTKSGALDSLSAPHNLQQSIEGLFSDKSKPDTTAVNFTVYRLAHDEHGKLLSYGEFLGAALAAASVSPALPTPTDSNTAEVILSVSSVFFKSYLDSICKSSSAQLVAVRRVNWFPSQKVARSVLSLVVAPLFGDMFSMQSYSIAAKQMGAGGPLGLKALMPLFLSHVVQQPVSQIVTNLLTKKLSSSTFQRWLRDTLLTFQDLVTSSAVSVHARIDFDQNDASEDDNAPASTAGAAAPITVTLVKRASIRITGERPHDSDDDSHHNDGDNHSNADENEEGDEAVSISNVSRSSSFSEETDYLTKLTKDIVESRKAAAPSNADQNDLRAVPTYDEFVRHLLRPAWCCARSSGNLEAALAFAAIVVETLLTVHEQVERRTYGACSLVVTMKAWENLIRQLRVCLLLSSRIGLTENEITVEKLSNGRVSLHKLLAADTLSFALKADQAIEHEERCQEVFNRRTAALNSISGGGGGGGDGDSQQHKSDVLLAWGKVADKRWRNLIEVAIAEDTLEFELQQSSGGEAKNEGEDPSEEGTGGNSNSSIAAAAAQKRKPPVKRRRPLLLYFPKHSQQRFLGAYRGHILADRWSNNLSHVYELSSASEHLYALPINWRGAVAADIYRGFVLPALRLFVQLEDDAESSQESKQSTAMSQQLLVIIADLNLLKTFIRSAVEILKYIEIAIINGKHLNSVNAEAEAVPDIPLTSSAAASGEHSASFFEDEEVEAIWPSNTDKRLCRLYNFFYDRDHKISSQWSEAMVKAHISILWVMQLRFQCGLRGIKPVKVLGTGVLSSIDTLYESRTLQAKDLELPDEIIPIRTEFLKQCLRRLISVDPPVNVYKLAELWGVDLNRVRLLHITALLERGNMDDEVDLLVPQVTDKGALVETLTEILRGRLGGIVARIDRLSIFGPLIASMDTEAIGWARKALPAEYSPEPSTLEDIAKGRVKAVNINLISTRHLVMTMQGILLAVPVVDRYSSAPVGTATSSLSSEGDGNNLASSWLERKSKCDALLSLCNSFSQLSNSSRSANK